MHFILISNIVTKVSRLLVQATTFTPCRVNFLSRHQMKNLSCYIATLTIAVLPNLVRYVLKYYTYYTSSLCIVDY